jgi:hypothetical protein
VRHERGRETMGSRNYRYPRCPYCPVYGEEGDDVGMSPDCGYHLTMGKARRGRPDPANHDEVLALKERVTNLEARLVALEKQHLDLAMFTGAVAI